MTRIKRNGMILIVIRLVLDPQMWVVKSVLGSGAAFPVHKSHLFEYLGIENK